MLATESLERQPRAVANFTHTWGLLGILAAVFVGMYLLQHQGAPAAAPQQTGAVASPIPAYLESMAFDWAILAYVWGGVRDRGGSLLSLSGRGWAGWRDVARDVGIAIPFWLAWEAVAYGVFTLLAKTGPAPADGWVTPHGILLLGLWLATSLSAGFCEELIFRGYLQRQFGAMTGRVWLGVLLQAAVFGAIHPRSWQAVLVISVLGVLYGALAVWRQNLRPGMLAHGWSDVWEGWLKHVLGIAY